MKIVLINQEHAAFSGPGGAERSVQSIADHMAAAGHQVTFISMSRKSYMREVENGGVHSVRDINGVKTILLCRRAAFPSHADLIVPLILHERPDIIHTNVFHQAPQLWEALAPLGIPILHTLREYKLMCPNNMFDGIKDCGDICATCEVASEHAVEMSRYVDGVVGISKFTLARHLGRGLFPNATLKRVIYNSYKRKGATPDIQLDSGKRRPRVGFLGRMHASKGINLVIDAFSQLDQEDASLVMAGDLQDRNISERVKRLAETHPAEYIGFVDPPPFFAGIDFLLIPSIWHEPFGRISIEAFAHGVPVIATRRGGLSDIVEEGKTGWLFDPDYPDELVKILKDLQSVTPEQMVALRTNAVAAAERYLPHVVGDNYLAAYEEVIAAKKKTVSSATRKLFNFYARDSRREDVLDRMRSKRSLRERRPIKVMIVAGEFPKLSETFVLNHVTGLLDLGADVRVLYSRRGAANEVPLDYLKYRLDERSVSMLPPLQEESLMRLVGSEARAIGSRFGAVMADNALADPRATATFEQAKVMLDTTQQKLMDLHAAKTLAEEIGDVDVIHCHFGHRPKMIYKYLDMIGKKVPMVCSYHGIDMSAHIKSFGPTLYDDVKGRLHKALPISNFFRQRLLNLGFDPKDIQVHRVGVDCTKFSFSDRRRADGEPLRLVSVGRVVIKKGFEFGIRGIAAAIARRPDMKLVYNLVGDGDQMPGVRAAVAELNIGHCVNLLGSRSHNEVTTYLANSHAMMATSITGPDGDMEGIPTVTMEAMATGLPVLSTYHSGIPEAVIHGYTGLLAEELDVEGLADNIITLYDNPDLGSRFGRQGRAHVLSEFNIERQNGKVLDLYEQIAFGKMD
jgi:colanic acid/amylovoran biosynthesis glycosyltransferase